MKTRFYVSHSMNKEEIKSNLKDFDFLKLKYPKMKLVYLFDEENLLDENIDEQVFSALKIISNFGVETKDFAISFDHCISKNLDHNKALEKLIFLENKYKNVNFGIEDDDITWSSDKILSANSQIDKMVEEIKTKNLSEIESLLYAYMLVTNRKYNDAFFEKNKALSRSIYGVLNSKKIVCVGYCELFREIISKLELKNVKIFLNNVVTEEHGQKSHHRNIVVFVDDKKYSTKGYYLLDPTNDSKTTKIKTPKLNYFLLAFSELKNLKDYCYKSVKDEELIFNEVKKFSYFYGDTKIFHHPEKSNFVAFSQKNAIINKEFYDFIKKDENYCKKIEKLAKVYSENYVDENSQCKENSRGIDELKYYLNFFYDDFKANNPPIKLEIIYKALNTIFEKQGYKKAEISAKMNDILKTNFQMNKYHFNSENNSTFSNKILQKYHKNSNNGLIDE